MGMNPSPTGTEGVLVLAVVLCVWGFLPYLLVLTVSALLEPWWEPRCAEWRDVGQILGVPP